MEYRDEAVKTLSALKETIDRLSCGVNDDVMRGPSQLRDGIASKTQWTGPKLPKLERAPFRRDVIKWQDYWEQFENVTNKNRSLSDTGKFHHLRRCATGEGASAVAALQITEACYQDAAVFSQNALGTH